MYRESPYFMQNEAYIFDTSSLPHYIKEDKNMVHEIEHSMNQMSICTPSKQQTKKNHEAKQFMSLFNRNNHEEVKDKQIISPPAYCRVCSRECVTTIEQCQLAQKPLSFVCHCCSYWVCQNCAINCDRCAQITCKFCFTMSYLTCGDYAFCEYCN